MSNATIIVALIISLLLGCDRRSSSPTGHSENETTGTMGGTTGGRPGGKPDAIPDTPGIEEPVSGPTTVQEEGKGKDSEKEK